MSKIILNVAASLDGYISRLDGSVDFLDHANTDWAEEFKKFTNEIDVIVMGRTSYDQMLSFGPYPFSDKKTYVLTSREAEEKENFTFTDMEIEDLIIEMKKVSKKKIWLFGGAKVIKQFVELNMVDEYMITITPILLGTGIPLFLFTKKDIELELVETKQINNLISLLYKRK